MWAAYAYGLFKHHGAPPRDAGEARGIKLWALYPKARPTQFVTTDITSTPSPSGLPLCEGRCTGHCSEV